MRVYDISHDIFQLVCYPGNNLVSHVAEADRSIILHGFWLFKLGYEGDKGWVVFYESVSLIKNFEQFPSDVIT